MWPRVRTDPETTRRDGRPALLDAFAAALQQAGLRVAARREVTPADVAELGSSWAKRLGIPHRRAAWWLCATWPDQRSGRFPS
ncbi:MAG: hypothetical protein M3069_30140 [Chloroflexota bacterium]|nr:hypothetical protein [Chloroflexota bacterium]